MFRKLKKNYYFKVIKVHVVVCFTEAFVKQAKGLSAGGRKPEGDKVGDHRTSYMEKLCKTVYAGSSVDGAYIKYIYKTVFYEFKFFKES